MVGPLLAGVPFGNGRSGVAIPQRGTTFTRKVIRSNRQQILFLVREVRVDLSDRLVGRGLNIFFQPL
jgi:hypothetical protein